ncbi:ATP-grasp domain-containing protein [Bifidobacterium thermophilum]|uniref:carboxylate--amine ligase n=1 Tax=Bifidobacterium thermophilum TaxID=33905 RepID=UPI0039957C64
MKTRIPSSQQIVPVLLGSGANAYGLARGFYREFGVVSVAVGHPILLQCRHSRYVMPLSITGLNDEQSFEDSIHHVAEMLTTENHHRKLLIIACGDTSAALLARHKAMVSQDYLTASCDGDILEQASDKAQFWRLCQKANVPTPNTSIYSYADFQAHNPIPLPDNFPLAVKAADSVSYLSVNFQGRKKAYIVRNNNELNTVVTSIFTHGYRKELVIQEFIPGTDDCMRTINAYVNIDGTIAMMCMGKPILEEYAPSRIGNYAAIISGGDDEIYEYCHRLINTLHYTGFINFDVKIDSRDNSYRFFEINPRPGGSSDFTSQAGYNLARWVWRDLILNEHHSTVTCHTNHLWLGVSPFIMRQFTVPGPSRDEAIQLLKDHRWSRSAFDWHDMNPARLFDLLRWQIHVSKDYFNYAPKRTVSN